MGTICKQAHTVQAKKYFIDRKDTNESIVPGSRFNSRKSNIKLEFTIENIEINHLYQIKVNISDQDPFATEKVRSHYPIITFNTRFMGCYYFEKLQILTLTLFKDERENCSIRISLGAIVGSKENVFKVASNNNVIIKISAEGISNNASNILCGLEAKHTNPSDNFIDPKDKISYIIISEGRKIYSSESISNNGKFNSISIPTDLLNSGFGIQFLDGYQEQIGYTNENIHQFIIHTNDKYLGVSANGKRINIYNKSFLISNVTFIDYIKAGVEIQLYIGIDYTSSNLPPNDPRSLHYQGNQMNDYEQAILSCGMILAYYDYDQKFPTLGYGALLNGEQQVNMCFNVNFKQDPEIYLIDNVLKEYRNSFKYLQLAGPNNFYPLIRRVVDTIKHENNPLKYNILLLLTDGLINDLWETIDVLVEGSFLPLSVIIIGIGNHHFQEMVVLDGDIHPLIDSKGVVRMRDLVQFVPFNRFKNDPTKLAEAVLEEIPDQVMEYYAKSNIDLNIIKQQRAFNTQNAFFNNLGQATY